ncbi:pyruvate kinase-like protein [Echria macrotheca]|uniref:Pyruvate kinase-like protein n=1 Tax=Echria macrotheca TaxID=438768 RepID=A0AAJ0B4C2_9PEZI|nr:pyruvate kinase-like protein [Echria macrotheca]
MAASKTEESAAGARAEIDLRAPFTRDTLLEVRSGELKPLGGLDVLSGIDKSILEGPVHIGLNGIDGDEHDYTFHGGPEKAILGYCSSHYPDLKEEYPTAAASFIPGGFGENFVTAHMNERNVCLGDVVAVGDDNDDDDKCVLLEVCLPRQPCFKLNLRFELKNFAATTWKTSRTGWYYRVLREGTVKAGDTIRLVSRPHPEWTVERVQEYLHRNKDDVAMNEQLASLAVLGVESRKEFQRRVARQKAKERKAREPPPRWRDFRVVERKRETPRIMSFTLEAAEPLADAEDIKLESGSHAKIKLGNGLVRAYSIVGGDRNRFTLGIALADADKSRGGSRYMHDVAQVGHVLQVGAMTAGIPIPPAASHHVFVAGGIGLTAFLPLMEHMKRINYSIELHYAVRSEAEVPFRERLRELGEDSSNGSVSVVIYDRAAGQRLDIPAILAGSKWNSSFYFCGPRRLMDEAARETKARCIPDSEAHFEAFEADISGDPFEAVVANKGGKVLKVGGEETLLEVLQKHFDDVDSSCAVGNCGTCKIGLKEGRVEHRGTALSQSEKMTSMLACVSRGIGRITVEI